jgi:hypothetical protein
MWTRRGDHEGALDRQRLRGRLRRVAWGQLSYADLMGACVVAGAIVFAGRRAQSEGLAAPFPALVAALAVAAFRRES